MVLSSIEESEGLHVGALVQFHTYLGHLAFDFITRRFKKARYVYYLPQPL